MDVYLMYEEMWQADELARLDAEEEADDDVR
jgi:hypothetical protein